MKYIVYERWRKNRWSVMDICDDYDEAKRAKLRTSNPTRIAPFKPEKSYNRRNY